MKLNSKKLVGLSSGKSKEAVPFFSRPQQNNKSSNGKVLTSFFLSPSVYRTSYGVETIPGAAEATFQNKKSTYRLFIAPEYQEYHDVPNKLPKFLKEQLINNSSYSTQMKNLKKKPQTSLIFDNNTSSFPLVSPQLKSFNPANLINRKKRLIPHPLTTPDMDPVEYEYLSPKARQQMKSDSVPILMSSVFLNGIINPIGIAKQGKPAIEYIINEHHEKAKNLPSEVGNFHQTNSTNGKKLERDLNVLQLSKEEKNDKSPKQIIDRIGMKLKATVGQLKMEREFKRNKVLTILRTKNFNRFRANTINNLHVYKNP